MQQPCNSTNKSKRCYNIKVCDGWLDRLTTLEIELIFIKKRRIKMIQFDITSRHWRALVWLFGTAANSEDHDVGKSEKYTETANDGRVQFSVKTEQSAVG